MSADPVVAVIARALGRHPYAEFTGKCRCGFLFSFRRQHAEHQAEFVAAAVREDGLAAPARCTCALPAGVHPDFHARTCLARPRAVVAEGEQP